MNSLSESAKSEEARPIFFYKLNQLRMFGALLVFVTHVELCKSFVQLPHLPLIDVIKVGHQGLNFFFVLSGFLITYLMLREYRASGSIKIRNFYMRRILRVWPLYYMVIALAFVGSPHLDAPLHSIILDSWRTNLLQNYHRELILYCAMLPNLANCILAPPSCAAPVWTVGVEEQFYILWPLLFWLLRKRIWLMMPFSILSKYLIIGILGWVSATVSDAGQIFAVTLGTNVLKHFDIEGLGMGAFAAYLLVSQPGIVKFMTSPIGRLGIVMAFFVAIPFMPHMGDRNLSINRGIVDFGLADLIFAIAYGWACVVLASGDKPKTALGKLLNYAGTITYGFYMYHSFAVLLFLQLLVRIPGAYNDPLQTNFILYGGAFTLTIIVSAISYECYESRFQRLKRFFSYARKPAENQQNN